MDCCRFRGVIIKLVKLLIWVSHWFALEVGFFGMVFLLLLLQFPDVAMLVSRLDIDSGVLS